MKMKDEQDVLQPDQTQSSGNDFFSNPDKDYQDFIKQMKRPKEKIDAPDIEIDDPDIETPPNTPGDTQQSLNTSIQLQYDPEDLNMAELVLILVDQLHAGVVSRITLENIEKYQTKKAEFTGKADYKTQLLASIIYKYKFKVSIEGQFGAAMTATYLPVWIMAYQDYNNRLKKEEEAIIKAQREREQQRQQQHQTNDVEIN